MDGYLLRDGEYKIKTCHGRSSPRGATFCNVGSAEALPKFELGGNSPNLRCNNLPMNEGI